MALNVGWKKKEAGMLQRVSASEAAADVARGTVAAAELRAEEAVQV
jgi:hypothetical protein